MSVEQAIAAAEAILPGAEALQGEDPRWQAIIAVGQHIPAHPDAVWEFARRWGASPDEDLRAAVATCLLEHLLEHDFDSCFPRIELEARRNSLFADCFSRTWAMGQALEPGRLERFEALKSELAAV